MQADCPSMAARERLEIAKRLSLLQHTKRKRFIGQRHIDSVVGGHLYEHTARRSALVKLPSRMQKARPISRSRRNVNSIAQVSSNCLDQLLVFRCLLNIVQHRNVIACVRPLEMRGDKTVNGDARSKFLDC